MSKPWRLWLTGGIAAVLAAASQAQDAGMGSSLSCASPYSVDETVERLERHARRLGLPVFAKVEAPEAMLRRGLGASCESTWLLVLGVDANHTAVLQAAPDAGLDIPLTVRVESRTGGRTEVSYSDPDWLSGHLDALGDELPAHLPGELRDRAEALPALVEAALR